MWQLPRSLVWLFLTASVAAQSPSTQRVADLLPKGAQIIETANVPVRAGRQRELVLWMTSPRRVMTTWDWAGDRVYGDHWLGPTFLSLVDPSELRLINTIRIRRNEQAPEDKYFAVPFLALNGPYYVPHSDKDGKGKPVLLHLQDFTGEGVGGQFVLFDHVASGIAAGSVQGYSVKSDSAVQYPIELLLDNFKPVVQTWANQVFESKQSRPGYWKFTWEQGHGDENWVDEEVRFDPARQLFVEKKTLRPSPGSDQFRCNLNTTSLTAFVERMRGLTQDDTEIQWLEGMIRKAKPNAIGSAGMVPTIGGKIETYAVSFQSSAGGEIGIEISSDSNMAARLHAALEPWCSGK